MARKAYLQAADQVREGEGGGGGGGTPPGGRGVWA